MTVSKPLAKKSLSQSVCYFSVWKKRTVWMVQKPRAWSNTTLQGHRRASCKERVSKLKGHEHLESHTMGSCTSSHREFGTVLRGTVHSDRQQTCKHGASKPLSVYWFSLVIIQLVPETDNIPKLGPPQIMEAIKQKLFQLCFRLCDRPVLHSTCLLTVCGHWSWS